MEDILYVSRVVERTLQKPCATGNRPGKRYSPYHQLCTIIRPPEEFAHADEMLSARGN
jgi:hypothetical protein